LIATCADAALEFGSSSKSRTASRDDNGKLFQLVIGPFALPRRHGINSSTFAFSICAMMPKGYPGEGTA
jgi:hypothetical protein